MSKTKTRPCVGDQAWLVDWCYELAFESDGESVDRDSCKHHTRLVATREEAEAMARKVYPETMGKFGYVEYWPVTFVAYDDDDAIRYPHVGFWEATDDGTCYDGEE